MTSNIHRDTSATGKSIIITGGLSGIGHAIAEHLATQSNTITLLDLPNPSSSSIVETLQSSFPKSQVSFQGCDISDWSNQAAAFKQIYEQNGSIDVVFANAGVSEKGNFLQRDDGEPTKPDLRTLDVNLVGTLYSVKLAMHYMRKNDGAHKGSIICTASNAGIYPFSIAPMYGASKHAVVGAVRSLARSLEPEGIQINAICPNVIATNLADKHLFSSMTLTSMSTLLSAMEEIITNTKLSGATLEASGDKFTVRQPPEWVDEISRTNFEKFWELGYA